jgi:hypothetical protein
MKKIALLISTMITTAAFADSIIPLDSMAVTCTEEVGFLAVVPNKIEIDFFEDSLFLKVNGEEKQFDTVLKAGTEGGAPYIQFVANGFVNFIISGPMLSDAFAGLNYTERSYRNGGLSISVDDLRLYQPDFKAECQGYFSF